MDVVAPGGAWALVHLDGFGAPERVTAPFYGATDVASFARLHGLSATRFRAVPFVELGRIAVL